MKTVLISFFMVASVLAETLKGTAKNDRGVIVYSEIHNVERSSDGLTKKVTTTYFKPDGTQFGHLISEFNERLFIPDSEFKDLRFGRKYLGKVQVKEKRSVYVIEEFQNEKLVKTSEVELKDDLISGPGFDNFISQQIVKAKKTKLPVHFLVLPRHSDYRFNVSSIETDSVDTRKYKIKPATLLSLFVKEIVITYEGKVGLLKRYEGLSNLPADNDESQNVVIDYEKIEDAQKGAK